MEMMKKHILGYNAESAMQLSRKEVKKLTRKWMRKSGTVGQLEGNELFNDLVGIKVCLEQNIIGCIAFFWRTIVNDILYEDHQDCGRSVYMVVFPHCQALYTYEKHVLLNQIIDLGSDLCLYLGPDLSLTMFHPHYKNAPKMFSPERHSPFPTSGLRFQPNKDTIHELPDSSSLYLNSERLYFERIFNSAAATATQEESENNLSTKMDVSRLKVPCFEQKLVIKMTKQWFDDNQSIGNDGLNLALKSIKTTNGWFVSKATIAEEAYADTWGIIYQLYKQRSDQEATSAILITPSFSTYNAPQWRKFAITVNAVLKRVTKGKMTLELFHSEYAGKNDRMNIQRRTPFPTLQIICHKS